MFFKRIFIWLSPTYSEPYTKVSIVMFIQKYYWMTNKLNDIRVELNAMFA